MPDWFTITAVIVAVGWGVLSATLIIPYFVIRKIKKGSLDKPLLDIGTGILSRLQSGDAQASGGQAQDINAILSQLGVDSKSLPAKGHAPKGAMQGGMDPKMLGSIGGLVKQVQSDPELMKSLMGQMPDGMKQGVMTDGIKDLIPAEYRKYVKNPIVQMFLEKIMTNMMQKQMAGGNSPITVNASTVGGASTTQTQYKKVI
jgi:hypothetical protein